MSHKRARIEAHSFDSLPAHISASATGTGSNARIAIQNAVGKLFKDPALKHKQIHAFKLSVILTQEEVRQCTNA